MKNLSGAALAAALLVTGCATPTVVETVKPGDSGLSCAQLQNEFADAERFRKQAQSVKGVTGDNVARALLFWPAILGSYSNANEAISAADARKVHLANLMDDRHCALPGAVAPVQAQAPETVRPAPAMRRQGAPISTGAPGLPAAGTTWTYESVGRVFSDHPVEITVRVLSVVDADVEELVTSNASGAKDVRRDIDARKSGFLEYPLDSDNDLIELSPYLLAINRGKAPANVSVPVDYPMGGEPFSPWITTIDERGWERVHVRAGAFRALRIDVSGRRARGIQGRGDAAESRFEMSVWYAPTVKRFVKLERKVWSASTFSPQVIGDEVVELVAYRPPS